MSLTRILLISLALAAPAQAEKLANKLFGAMDAPSNQDSMPIGSYAKGCAAGLVELPETGPTWQAMRLSRHRNFGHPMMIQFLMDLSATAREIGYGKGLYIGDISQPRGGPMTSGHASHQMGLDADIWLLPPQSLQLSRAQREKISSQSVVNKAGTAPSGLWSAAHMAIIRAAARDPRVERIFIDPVAKVAMCDAERGDRSWLRKIRPIANHDYHFHVRLGCPAGSVCKQQDVPPPGDGCAEAAEWIKNRIDPSRVKPVPPDPNYRHPRTFRLSEMPRQCQAVATAR